MPASSLAAIFHSPGRPLELRRIALPDRLLPGEALVRVTCCTLCGSDLSTLAGQRQEPVPCILGHEITGIISALSEEPLADLRGKTVKIGDRVVWSIAASCGNCRNCRRNVPQKCSTLRKYGHQRLQDDWQLSGGLAEYCQLVAGTKVLIIDDALPDAVVCPASCATATVAAALRTAGTDAAERVLIFGAGLLGLTASAMAKQLRAEKVTVCDVSADRLELAARFAADETIPWTDFSRFAESNKFDLILEMSGNALAVQAALSAGDIGACVVLVGSVRPTPPIDLFPEQLIRRVQSLHGVHNYRPDDLLAAVDFLSAAGHRFPFEELVSQQFNLSAVNDAVGSPQLQQTIRMAIIPEE